jgi:glycosyl transferase family WbsX
MMKNTKLTFARLSSLFGCLMFVASVSADPPPAPLVGAIRWDAWHGDKGEPGKAVQQALGPKKWHYRLPFFAEVVSDDAVRFPGYTQEIVDREIAYAHDAGINYWAFMLYAPDDPMSEALSYYLASKQKQDVRFCGIGSPVSVAPERVVRLMADDAYVKVLNGRPLFYLFCPDPRVAESAAARRWLDEIRARARQANLNEPYLVIMGFDPAGNKRMAEAFGAGAVTSYSTSNFTAGLPYADLARHAEHFWDRCRDTGCKVVPIVQTGDDRRPRVERPVPWEKDQKPGVGIERYHQQATPAELAEHLLHALQWVRQHPNDAEPNAVIIYAWNENDEGGWLVPTLFEGPARLNALRTILRFAGQ